MRNELKLVFGFLGLSMFCLSAFSAQGQGIGDRNRPAGAGNFKILGRILLPDGQPARDVNVTASSGDNPSTSTFTDIDGNYVISGLTSGNYTVSVRETGYSPETEFITISEGSTSGQSFQAAFYLRLPGQPKRKSAPPDPNLVNVPKVPAAKYQKALEYLSKGDAKTAIPLFDEAIGAYPNFAAAYYQKGAAFLRMNDLDKAVEAFVKAIQIKPDYIEAKYGYGMAMFDKRNYEVAEAVFRDVLKQKTDFPEAHQNLGISLFYLKNPDEAERELKSAFAGKSGEKLALGHLYLGQIYAQKKRNADAVVELQKYLDLAPKAPNSERVKTIIADLKKQG